jgi:hypothetical protein
LYDAPALWGGGKQGAFLEREKVIADALRARCGPVGDARAGVRVRRVLGAPAVAVKSRAVCRLAEVCQGHVEGKRVH